MDKNVLKEANGEEVKTVYYSRFSMDEKRHKELCSTIYIKALVMCMGLIAVLVGAALLFYISSGGGLDALAGIVSAVAVVGVAVSLSWKLIIRKNVIKKAYYQTLIEEKTKTIEREYACADKVMSLKNGEVKDVFDYEAVEYIEETDNFIMLRYANDVRCIFDKKALTGGSADEFRKFILEKCVNLKHAKIIYPMNYKYSCYWIFYIMCAIVVCCFALYLRV